MANAPSRIIKNHKCCYNLHYVREECICMIKSLKERRGYQKKAAVETKKKKKYSWTSILK